MKRFQLFIHRYYDGIKLILSLAILILVTYSLLNQIQINAEASKERGDAVLEVSKTIKEETAAQTEVINRQFQALCFLVVETAGADALKQLDPPLEEQCRNLAAELKEEQTEQRQEQSAGYVSAQSPAAVPRGSSGSINQPVAPARGETTEGVAKSDNPTTSGPAPLPATPTPQSPLDLRLCVPLISDCNSERLRIGGDK